MSYIDFKQLELSDFDDYFRHLLAQADEAIQGCSFALHCAVSQQSYGADEHENMLNSLKWLKELNDELFRLGLLRIRFRIPQMNDIVPLHRGDKAFVTRLVRFASDEGRAGLNRFLKVETEEAGNE